MTRWLPLLAAGLWACPAPSPSGTDAGRTRECEARDDCAEGLVCTAQGFCDGCASSGQCSVKEVCEPDTRRCALRDGWGTACAANDDCQAGSWCRQGLCVARAQVSLCLSGDSASCPTRQRCNRVTSVCEEDLGCATNDDCSSGEVCNAGLRQCVPRCTAETEALLCGPLERCAFERCVECTAATDCAPGLLCDAAGRCSAGSRCYSDRDCAVPLVCLPQTGACLPAPPPCASNDTCAADERCDVSAGRCVPRACQRDRYEPNDDAGAAFQVTAAAYRALTLCPGDVDWYALPLARGDQLGVNVDADPFSEGLFSTQVKDGAGRTVASGKLLASYTAPTAATYFVVISVASDVEDYGVTFLTARGTPCDDDAHEPNDSAAQPTALNASSEVDGVVCPQDEDWFRLGTAPDGGALRVRLTAYEAGRGPLVLCLFPGDGGAALGCSSEVQPALSSATDGQLVRVSGASARVANAYTLEAMAP